MLDPPQACGSGGTSAGLALGSWLSGLRARVLAFGVCDTPDYFYDHVDQLCAELGAGPADVGTNARGLLQVVNAKGSGYAISREDELRCIAETAAATGVVLDPVYSGKALHGLLEEMRRDASAWAGRRVLFVHTGGLLGLYDKAEQLQPLLAQVAAAAAATTAAAEATATATAAATASLTAAAAAAPADTGAATAGSEDATSAAAGSSSSGNYASGGSSAAVARRRRRCCVVERMQVE